MRSHWRRGNQDFGGMQYGVQRPSLLKTKRRHTHSILTATGRPNTLRTGEQPCQMQGTNCAISEMLPLTIPTHVQKCFDRPAAYLAATPKCCFSFLATGTVEDTRVVCVHFSRNVFFFVLQHFARKTSSFVELCPLDSTWNVKRESVM